MKEKSWNYFTERDRYYIETSLKEKVPVKDIAKILHKDRSSIYREINRGTVILQNSDLTFRKEYCADYAQARYDILKKNHGPDLKIGSDIRLSNFIEDKIINEKLSPYAVSVLIKQGDFSCSVSYQTIYSYIDKGIFYNLTNKHLPIKDHRKREYNKRSVALNNKKGRSIEERPEYILDREEFGHWEMDSVIGKPNETKSVFTVLTERKTRKEIVLHSNNKSSAEVVRQLNLIENNIGANNFRLIFKSITVDNGSEFLDQAGLEKSCLTENERTRIYYCHPFCSCERGSNENQNRLVRRWYPKGYNLDLISDDALHRLNIWINNLPRKMFNGLTSEDLFTAEIKLLNLDHINFLS